MSNHQSRRPFSSRKVWWVCLWNFLFALLLGLVVCSWVWYLTEIVESSESVIITAYSTLVWIPQSPQQPTNQQHNSRAAAIMSVTAIEPATAAYIGSTRISAAATRLYIRQHGQQWLILVQHDNQQQQQWPLLVQHVYNSSNKTLLRSNKFISSNDNNFYNSSSFSSSSSSSIWYFSFSLSSLDSTTTAVTTTTTTFEIRRTLPSRG